LPPLRARSPSAQRYERRFVEFQSGVPFRAWREMVATVEQALLPALPDGEDV